MPPHHAKTNWRFGEILQTLCIFVCGGGLVLHQAAVTLNIPFVKFSSIPHQNDVKLLEPTDYSATFLFLKND